MKICIGGKFITKKKQTTIKGSGTVPLLDGGKGGQNSYDGIDDYIATTKNAAILDGSGLGKSMFSKLKNLSLSRYEVKKKPQNIKFNI